MILQVSSSDKPQTWAERAALGATEGDRARYGSEVTLGSESRSDRRAEVHTVDDVLALLTWAAGFDRIKRGRMEAEAWLSILAGFDGAEVRRAITAHYRGSRFPVTPADIVEIIEEGIEE